MTWTLLFLFGDYIRMFSQGNFSSFVRKERLHVVVKVSVPHDPSMCDPFFFLSSPHLLFTEAHSVSSTERLSHVILTVP